MSITLEEFYKKHCKLCGTQLCGGCYDEDFRDGCGYYQKEILGREKSDSELLEEALEQANKILKEKEKNKITNLDAIKFFANNKPELLAELLDNIYVLGWNEGAYVQRTGDDNNEELCFTLEWLNSPLDIGLIRESDITDMLNNGGI